MWILLYVAGYTVLAVAGYVWYQLPVLFVAHIFAALGLIWVMTFLHQKLPDPSLAVVMPIAVAAAFLFVMGRPTVTTIKQYGGDPRAESYMGVAQWFRDNTQHTESVAYIEIGYLGYYTDNRIIDLAGLVSLEAVPHIAQGDAAWAFWHYQPDYYIYLPDFDWALAGIRADARFTQDYEAVATLQGPRDTDFTIFRKKSLKR
jgi:hypothetical protein